MTAAMANQPMTAISSAPGQVEGVGICGWDSAGASAVGASKMTSVDSEVAQMVNVRGFRISPSLGTPGEGRGGGCIEDAQLARTPSLTLPRSTEGGNMTSVASRQKVVSRMSLTASPSIPAPLAELRSAQATPLPSWHRSVCPANNSWQPQVLEIQPRAPSESPSAHLQ